ncbi:MAG TPA: glycosyltransferase family 39 protein [Anaerolineales bacterium]|nr:glycosyltransferase family 39 protein [Anaerolineales bacterium]
MSDDLEKTGELDEPSVLDYVKSLLRFGNGKRIRIPGDEKNLRNEPVKARHAFVTETPVLKRTENLQQELSFVEAPAAEVEPVAGKLPEEPAPPFPWRSLLAFLLAWIAQAAFEPPHTGTAIGLAFYVAALAVLALALRHGEWRLPSLAPASGRTDPLTYRGLPLILAGVLALVSFSMFGGHLFTRLNVIVWILAFVCLLWAFWLNERSLRFAIQRWTALLQQEAWTFRFSRWALLLTAVMALTFFFRFYQTTTVPPEPFSDHAEKILDVYDVTQGQTKVFFTRNTGRESFQMYWTVLIAKLFGTGLSFLSLKLGTAILGFLTLPFMYLLGKEIGGRRVGLFALFFAGLGYWPNVISRVGLRFPLYPLFAAPVLFFLLRGLRTHNRNDFLLSGVFLGIGLHGYSPMRIVPFIVVAAFVLYWLHQRQSENVRRQLPIWLVMLALVAAFVFLPLLRYWADDPAVFGFRAFTRLGNVEQPLPGPAYQIFASNLWNALRMFNYDDGEIWVHSVTHRPALDIVTAALFLIGVVLVLVRYLRQRNWLDLFLLVSIPLLSMPSILSLAFPAENPALNRAGAAFIPAFIIAAMALDGLLSSFGRGGMRSLTTWSLAGLVFLAYTFQNYNLVFNQYYTSFRSGSWNSSDMGKVVQEFEQIYGTTDTVWIVPFEHWVDTRLPAVWAGIPNRDMAMWRENLSTTVEIPGPKLFMVKADLERPEANDQETLNVLESLYPNGYVRLFDSDVPGHDFWIYSVPTQ